VRFSASKILSYVAHAFQNVTRTKCFTFWTKSTALQVNTSLDLMYLFSCLLFVIQAVAKLFSSLTYFIALLCLHRMIQSAFVDMESMFDLLKEEKEVSSH